MTLPTVALLLADARRREVLTPEAEHQLLGFARVVRPPSADLAADHVPSLLAGAVACITGWGTPPLNKDVLDHAPDLQLVAHTAGSIRNLLPAAAVKRGLRVSHAAAIIADAVAEHVLAQAFLSVRQLHLQHQAMQQAEDWFDIRRKFPGRLVGNMRVGIIGTGRVGRAVIHLFRGLGSTVLASDPFLTPGDATELGVESVLLDELLERSDLVSLHAPLLDATRGMIGAAELARLQDGAVFINCARAPLVDERALLRELETRRIVAALDVFADEPLPPGSPFRRLPNVILSPHSAGHTRDTHVRQGQAMVDEVQRFVRGEPLKYEIGPEMLPVIA
jgi:phosphoglycerate dehydrogenase-like enzyme